MKKQILRIEDKEGRGMYHTLWSIAVTNLFGNLSVDLDKHPEPYEDKLLNEQWDSMRPDEEYFCGFVDEEQFKKWVHNPQWRKSLNFYGGIMKTYEVDECDLVVGETQVMFIKDKAMLIKEDKVTCFE